MASPRRVELPYSPRKAFLPFHLRTQRWACIVCHRRAGKTVSAINDLVKRAVLTAAVPGRQAHFAYIAPFRAQAKAVAWSYLKYYAAPIIKEISESDLFVVLVTGAKIQLFGADNADSMRGLGFDGVFMDEFGDFKPSVWALVIRPTLSDRMGWAVFAGTPKGKNHFWDVYDKAVNDPENWFAFRLKASESGILPQGELEDAKRTSSEDQFLQEYECSFEAAILGAYYGTEMRELEDAGRITDVKYDPSLPTFTAWDIGRRDDTAVWWYQVIRSEIHVIDFYSASGEDPDSMAKIINAKPYHYGKHWLPHDAKAKTFASQGKSTIEQLAASLGGIGMLDIVPNLSVQDGIQATRMMLRNCWFDAVKCKEGIEALRQYEREYDEDKKAFRQTPKHNWCFSGETRVLTRYGTCQIMNLPMTGEVLTSCGWKRYTSPRVTRKNASLVEVAFADGYSVRCTPDHTFKTASGWKSAESLTPGTVIQSSLTRSRSISMAGSIVFGRAKNILLAAAKRFIETFGELLLGQYRTVAISTTETATGRIINWQTWNACQPRSTFEKRSPASRSEHSMRKHEPLPLLGISPKKGAYGTGATPSAVNLGPNGSEKISLALNAPRSSTPWFESQGTLKSTAQRLAKLRHTVSAALETPHQLVIASVKKLNNTADVWCLTVPDAEEFSLANGATVHNCSHPADAFRMAAVSWQEEQPQRRVFPERALIAGPQNQATLEDMWAASRRQRKSNRI